MSENDIDILKGNSGKTRITHTHIGLTHFHQIIHRCAPPKLKSDEQNQPISQNRSLFFYSHKRNLLSLKSMFSQARKIRQFSALHKEKYNAYCANKTKYSIVKISRLALP